MSLFVLHHSLNVARKLEKSFFHIRSLNALLGSVWFCMGLYTICAYNIFSFTSTVTYVVLIKDESCFVRVVYDGYDGGNNGAPLT